MSDFRYQHPGGCSCGTVNYLLHCNLDLDELARRADNWIPDLVLLEGGQE